MVHVLEACFLSAKKKKKRNSGSGCEVLKAKAG